MFPGQSEQPVPMQGSGATSWGFSVFAEVPNHVTDGAHMEDLSFCLFLSRTCLTTVRRLFPGRMKPPALVSGSVTLWHECSRVTLTFQDGLR